MINRRIVFAITLIASGAFIALWNTSTVSQETISPDQLIIFTQDQGNAMLWEWLHAESRKMPERDFPPKSTADWDARRVQVRQEILSVLGIGNLEKTPLNVQVVGTVDRLEFTVTKLRWEGRPGFYTLANLWKPKNISGRLPAIFWIPGHTEIGKAAYGWPQNIFVRKGFIVLAIDWVGYSERTPQNHDKNAVCWTVGTNVAGLEIWDDIRAMDYLLSRDDVDSSRVGIAGRSGGGTQTTLLVGVEPRAAAYAPQAGFSSYHDAYIQKAGGHCLCNYIPNPMRWFDIADILSVGAPDKYIHALQGRMDPLFPIDGSEATVKSARRVFKLYDQMNHLQIFSDMGMHPATDAQIERMVQFFMKVLTPDNKDYSIPAFEHLTPEELAMGLPEDSKTSIDICREIRDALPTPQMPATRQDWESRAKELRKIIQDDVLGGWPERMDLKTQVHGQMIMDGVTMENISIETEPGLRIPLLLVHPDKNAKPGPVYIIASQGGKFGAFPDMRVSVQELKAMTEQGMAFAIPDLRGLGEMSPEPQGKLKFMRNYLEYELATSSALMGRPLAGMRAYDISRVVDYLLTRKDINPDRISLIGEGAMCPVALLASALDPRISSGPIDSPDDHFDTAVMVSKCPVTFFMPELPEDFSMQFYVPGMINLAGDVPVLAALTAPRGLVFFESRDADNKELDPEEAHKAFDFTRQIYNLFDSAENISIQ